MAKITIVTNKVLIISVKPKQLAQEASKEAGRLWTDIVKLHNYIRKRARINPGKWKWPSKGTFEKHFKGKYELHSQTIQAIVQKFFANIDTARQNRKNGNKKARYPYKSKFFYNPVFKGQSVKMINNRIRLPLKNKKYLWYTIPEIDGGKIVQVELKYNKLFLTVKREVEIEKNTSDKIAGLDIGIIHTAVITDGENDLAIVGRGIRSIKQGHAKNLAKISRKISKCKKGSNRKRKLAKAKRKLIQRTENLLRNALHHVSRKIVEFCVNNQISKLVIGDLKGINVSKKKKRRKQVNQEIGKMEFGTLKKYLKYKLAENGIELKEISESYTSQTCPVCGSLNKTTTRNYKCKSCSFIGIRDLVGASNIRNRYINKVIRVAFDVPDRNLKYLRPIQIKSVGRSSKPLALAKVA